MKDKDTILSLQETEELCRMYMDCQLSVFEETELQYILGKSSYTSPVIEEAREAMIAEGIVFRKKKVRKKTRFRWSRWAIGTAASLGLLLTFSIIIGTQVQKADSHETAIGIAQTADSSSEAIMIAYEGGKRLSPAASEKAVNESLKKAEALMAMAKAKEREDEIKQMYIMNLTSGTE
ncbi:MAG: hypothetical protein K2H47_11740 [Muribaculaceae bacterium]|nr:hypothetical protein [Muribaculaceae bacterium]